MIKNRRLELGLTMKEVANAVGVSEATVSRWENGDIAEMKRSRIYNLSKVLKISPVKIVCDEDKYPAPIEESGISEMDLKLLHAIQSLPADRKEALLRLLGIE